MIELDQWQKDVLATEGNICLRSGRQVGKSTVISILAAQYAVSHPNTTTMVVAAVERQAYLLFEKILNYLMDNHRNSLKTGKDRPTKHLINLRNGSRIYALPTGLTGYNIRGYTIDLLICDEAAFISQEVYTSITPSLATRKARIVLLSTPHGREGYFYQCFSDPTFTPFHISSEDCPRISKDFLEQERKRMSKREFAQEYQGVFIDELRQFFPDELIKRCMTSSRPERINPEADYFLGVDLARQGDDESTFQIIQRKERDNLIHVENLITRRTYLNESTNLILELEKKWCFKRIYVDSGGIGVGVTDYLREHQLTKRKLVEINNRDRPIDLEDKKHKKLLKEDLYNNLLGLMERGEIKLLPDDEIFLSLKSVQYEYNEKGQLIIFGNYTHICEGLIRAAFANRDKGLNIWCR